MFSEDNDYFGASPCVIFGRLQDSRFLIENFVRKKTLLTFRLFAFSVIAIAFVVELVHAVLAEAIFI